MDERKLRLALRGLHGPEREAEKLRLLTHPLGPQLIQAKLVREAKRILGLRTEWSRKRHVRFHLNLTPSEIELIKAHAKKKKLSIAAYIRSCCLGG